MEYHLYPIDKTKEVFLPISDLRVEVLININEKEEKINMYVTKYNDCLYAFYPVDAHFADDH